MKDKHYRNLEKELDTIIVAEINRRLHGKYRKTDFQTAVPILEQLIREIVEAYQQGKIATSLPSLFTGFLQIKENGALHFTESELSKEERAYYSDRKSSLEVLLAASLNALQDAELVSIVNRKNRLFEEEYQKAKAVMKLAEDALTIKKKADDSEAVIPRDEEEAVTYLKDIAPLRTALQTVESQFVEFKNDPYLTEAVKHFQTSITLASKSIAAQTLRASRFLFDMATTVFYKYQTTPAAMSNIELFIRQKEALMRFAGLFGNVGDENRKVQVLEFISTIEATIDKLQKGVVKQKQIEVKVSEKAHREVDEIYKQFLEIKQDYADGKLDSDVKKRQAVAALRKFIQILQANGQRVKEREIERFINSTGIAAPKIETPNYGSLPDPNIFYKKAFMTLLPITLLLGMAVLLLLSF